jgi:hypothetical protein
MKKVSAVVVSRLTCDPITVQPFIVLYRWRVKRGCEQQFIERWSLNTQWLREQGSFGSRLHRGVDGLFYSYAQWPDAQTRANAFAREVEEPSHQSTSEFIEESFPEVILEPVADYLVAPPKQSDVATLTLA